MGSGTNFASGGFWEKADPGWASATLAAIPALCKKRRRFIGAP
jgi:hypothetical protein